MKYLYYKDQHNRFLYQKNELNYFYLKFLQFYLKYQIFFISTHFFFKKLKRLQRMGKLRSRINNRCILTNRSQSIYRKFHLSRIQLRQLSLQGLLGGIRKAGW